MLIKTITALTSLLLLTCVSAKAEIYEDEKLPFGTVRSMDAMNSGGHPTAQSLALAAEMENRYGHTDKAVWLCQKALELDPEDIDIHKMYAESLEKKLRRQTQKDPDLFTSAVREWLIVMRGERGDEKGLSDEKGAAIPGLVHAYADEDRGIPARQHLIGLVGYPPRAWERDQAYLKRVSKAAEAIVNGRILKKNSTNSISSHSSSQNVKIGKTGSDN